jgi:hypothetical protein
LIYLKAREEDEGLPAPLLWRLNDVLTDIVWMVGHLPIIFNCLIQRGAFFLALRQIIL